MASSGAGGEIMRSRDGVPQWSGDAADFQDYEDAALLWEQGIPRHKRCLSEVTASTVQTVVRTNQLLQSAKARRNHKMVIHAFPQETVLGLYA